MPAHLLFRCLVGAIFATAGAAKLWAVLTGIPADGELLWELLGRSEPLYIFVAGVEMVVGVWAVSGYLGRQFALLILLLASLFLGHVVAELMSEQPRPCGYFGRATGWLTPVQSLWVMVVVDSVLVVVAARRWWSPDPVVRSVEVSRSQGSSLVLGSGGGFTLVELLVVIVIVGVLIGILIPVIRVVQRNARSAQCASNLRQVGTALLSYVQTEGKGRIPRGAIDFNTSDPLWVEVVGNTLLGRRDWQWPELASVRVLKCPDHPRIDPMPSTHYLMNAMAVDLAPNWRRSPPVAWGSIRNASGVAMLVEAADRIGHQRWPLGDLYFEPELTIWHESHLPGGPAPRIAENRHGKSSNAAFFDGHVERVSAGGWSINKLDDGIRGRFDGR